MVSAKNVIDSKIEKANYKKNFSSISQKCINAFSVFNSEANPLQKAVIELIGFSMTWSF